MILASAVLATGCDFIRASLGKPTSADLEILRREKHAREAAESAQVEAEAAAADSAATDSASIEPIVSAPSAESGSLKKYYAVAGAFKEEQGAQAYIEKLRENGFQVYVFDFRSGLKVVCAEGSDSLEDVRKDVAALKRLGLSPSDPWIYNTNQKLHK